LQLFGAFCEDEAPPLFIEAPKPLYICLAIAAIGSVPEAEESPQLSPPPVGSVVQS
jgi:hypothetical protein